jgi:hypothetical protein
VAVANKTDLWRLAYRAGWPALRVETSTNSAWVIKQGRGYWETFLHRAWPALIEAARGQMEQAA